MLTDRGGILLSVPADIGRNRVPALNSSNVVLLDVKVNGEDIQSPAFWPNDDLLWSSTIVVNGLFCWLQ